MFNKTKSALPSSKTTTTDVTPESSPPVTPKNIPTNSSRPSSSVIGSHTQVEGDINSDEDLTVEGRVRGTITCKQNTVTLGTNSYVNGDVFAHTLHVSGEVSGNLVALHRATIHKGAHVTGTIVAPCLVLEDGSAFHGSIDMSPESDVLQNAFSNTANHGTGSITKSSTVSKTSDANAQKITTDENSKTDANKKTATQTGT